LNKGALRFENVSFSYPTRPDVPVLKCLTIEVPQGMTTAIVGASGSGKSTMLELVTRFYEVTGVRTKPGESNDRDIGSRAKVNAKAAEAAAASCSTATTCSIWTRPGCGGTSPWCARSLSCLA